MESYRPADPTPSSGLLGTMRRRVLFWMSLMALGSLLIMAAQGYHCARHAIMESENQHLRSALRSRKARLEAWFSEVTTDLQFLALISCTPEGCGGSCSCGEKNRGNRCCRFQDKIRTNRPYYEAITRYAPDWKYLSGTTSRLRPETNFLPPDLKSALNTAEGSVISTSRLPRDKGSCIHLGQPVWDTNGKKAGYIVATLNLSWLFESILGDRSDLRKTGRAFLAPPRGQEIYTKSGPESFAGSPYRLPQALFAKTPPAVLAYKNHQGTKVLGASDSIQKLGWTLIVEIDQKEAFAWLGRLRIRTVVTGAVTLLITLALASRIAGRLSKPLQELAAVSRRIARGRHQERVGTLSGMEAQAVGTAFNRMLDELEESHRKLLHAATMATIGELSSSIVHEIRNPLSSIKINLQALHQKVQGDPTHEKLAEIASNQVTRLENMLSDLLSYGKPILMNPAPIRFRDITADVSEILKGRIQEKSITIEIEDKLGPETFVADPEQMRRALTNLVANAVQVTPGGGTVHIRAGIVSSNSGRVAISVQDDGPGIPPSSMDRLFQPFFTTHEGGTGLGLANVKKIVQHHGGSVTAENRSKRGAVFTMLLPREGSRT